METSPAQAVLRVRAAHLTDYAWQDRDGSGQPDQFKDAEEVAALMRDLTEHPAEVMLLRGLGSESALARLREHLSVAGLDLKAVYVPGPTVYAGIGFLSQREPEELRLLTDQSFRIRDQSFQPLAGGIRVDGVWFWNAEMAEPDRNYERRRNEARILAQNLRPLVEAGEAVLLSVHGREEADSPMIRLLEEAGLQRIAAVDAQGDGWTFRDPDGVNYRMDQWLFGSSTLLERMESATVADRPDLRKAGRFRHQEIQLHRDR